MCQRPHLCAGQVPHYRAHGAGKAFDKTVRAFRSDLQPAALLLSVSTAGQGLTLVEASEVIVVDPLFDDAKLAQANILVFLASSNILLTACRYRLLGGYIA